MGKNHLLRGAFATVTFVALAMMAVCARSSAQTEHNDEFVQRDGTRLTLGGETFRYSGPNIEWLGLEAYGPLDPMGPRYPSHFEVDDALGHRQNDGRPRHPFANHGRQHRLRSLHRAQAGRVQSGGFQAHRLRPQGRARPRPAPDRHPCRRLCQLQASGAGEYFKDARRWPATSDFFTDPVIAPVLKSTSRRCSITRTPSPASTTRTIPPSWPGKTATVCGIVASLTDGGPNTAPIVKWVDTIGAFIKSIDKKHLYEDNSGLFAFDKTGAVLDAKTPDIVTSEYYPHWEAVFEHGVATRTTAESFPKHAALVTSHGKVYVVTNSAGTLPTGPRRPTSRMSSPP